MFLRFNRFISLLQCYLLLLFFHIPPRLFVSLPALLLACFPTCLLACLLACLLSCLPACLVFLAPKERPTKSTNRPDQQTIRPFHLSEPET
uniref:Uncharacterized protein n=1 Tax=Anopheles quadriannulatus TaxID=34691 RepID=A0A182XJD5_ANOQN